MKWRTGAMLFVAVMGGGLSSGTPVRADTAIIETGRTIYHFTKAEVMEVGDAPGHVVGVGDQRGLVTTDRGEVGVWSSKVLFDLRGGSGPHQSYTVTTFEDRSTTVTAGKGTTTAHPDGTATFEGQFTYIGGTGRFAGIEGGGTYAGKRLAPIAPGVSVDLYQNYSARYTLPPR